MVLLIDAINELWNNKETVIDVSTIYLIGTGLYGTIRNWVNGDMSSEPILKNFDKNTEDFNKKKGNYSGKINGGINGFAGGFMQMKLRRSAITDLTDLINNMSNTETSTTNAPNLKKKIPGLTTLSTKVYEFKWEGIYNHTNSSGVTNQLPAKCYISVGLGNNVNFKLSGSKEYIEAAKKKIKDSKYSNRD